MRDDSLPEPGQSRERTSRVWGGFERNRKVAFGKDCDRLIYSSAFRRLNGVTQVVSAEETGLFHNRLTHSLKVAQVGVRLAQRVQALRSNPESQTMINRYSDGLDSRVIRAACLAHDLGHPPFGHIAERELQRLLAPDLESADEEARAPHARYWLSDSFEGNAQSFRIATKLAFRESAHANNTAALDLTRATLRALLKYPWLKNEDLPVTNPALDAKRKRKWGAYDSEKAIFEWARGAPDGRIVSFHGDARVEYRTLEAQVMDWADDISYAVHDAEDFFRAGLIPLHELKNSNAEFDDFFSASWYRLKDSLGGVIDESDARRALKSVIRALFPVHAFNGSRSDRELLHTLAASVIAKSVRGLKIAGEGLLLAPRQQVAVVELLKEMTWYYVIKRPALSSAQLGQVGVVRDLYFGLNQWIAQQGAGWAENIEEQGDKARWVLPSRLVDYLWVAMSKSRWIGCTSYTYPQKVSRAVVDYISSLTEAQAIALRSRVMGLGTPSMLDYWVQV